MYPRKPNRWGCWGSQGGHGALRWQEWPLHFCSVPKWILWPEELKQLSEMDLFKEAQKETKLPCDPVHTNRIKTKLLQSNRQPTSEVHSDTFFYFMF